MYWKDYSKEGFSKAIALTWFANMSEHLVLSEGSAVILRINCSIGVIPDKTQEITVT